MFSKNVRLAKLAQVVYINSPTKISAIGLIENEKSVKNVIANGGQKWWALLRLQTRLHVHLLSLTNLANKLYIRGFRGLNILTQS